MNSSGSSQLRQKSQKNLPITKNIPPQNRRVITISTGPIGEYIAKPIRLKVGSGRRIPHAAGVIFAACG